MKARFRKWRVQVLTRLWSAAQTKYWLRSVLQVTTIWNAGFRWCDKNEIGNNLRYADDTTLMAESEEKLKSLLMKVKVESKKLA